MKKNLLILKTLISLLGFSTFPQLVKAQSVEFILSGRGCNGFVGKMSANAQQVYIFTAGHCISGLLDESNSDKMIFNTPLSESRNFLVYSNSTDGRTTGISSSEITFASFQQFDLAVLSINQSESDLIRQGIEPLIVGDQPSVCTAITIRNVLTNELKSLCCPGSIVTRRVII
jgi:hypothetical protein